jgi:hypothetical protein
MDQEVVRSSTSGGEVMSRELKFRAWSSGTDTPPRMIPMDSSDLNAGTLSDLVEEEHWKVMQFTGLKDKNGVDIYEGDILENTNPIWKTEIICFAMSWGESNGCWDGFSPKEDFEIIGNIHANPELLEAK